MPQLVTVRVTRRARRPLRIWVPVLPFALVLSPVLVLAVLAAVVACLIFRVRVVLALRTLSRLVWALPGTQVDIAHGGAGVLVTIR